MEVVWCVRRNTIDIEKGIGEKVRERERGGGEYIDYHSVLHVVLFLLLLLLGMCSLHLRMVL